MSNILSILSYSTPLLLIFILFISFLISCFEKFKSNTYTSGYKEGFDKGYQKGYTDAEVDHLYKQVEKELGDE